MEESLIPSLSAGVVGSRFVTQDEVETAKLRREEQWKAAYARLGQEPPPQQQEEVYDGRSLAEKLAANRVAKQEEWEEKTKLANQFRALEEDEIMFLDSIREKQEEEERQRKEKDGEEVRNFKEAVAARTSAVKATGPPVTGQPPPPPPPSAKAKPLAAKKDIKKGLKGVVVKKKAKPTTVTKPADVSTAAAEVADAKPVESISKPGANEDDGPPDVKRRKIDKS